MSNAVIGNLRVDLQLMHASFQKGIGQVENRLTGLDKSFSNIQSTVSRFGAVLAGAVAGVAIGQVTSLADTYSDLQSRVGIATGSMETAGKTMDRLNKIASSTWSSVGNVTEGFIQNNQVLIDLGKSTEDAMNYTESLSNALIVSGAKGEKAARVQKALSDAMVLGKLSGDQLNAVLMEGDAVSKALADEMGTTVSGLRQLGADGMITGDIIANVIIKNQEKWREQAASMPGTFGDVATAFTNMATTVVGRFDTITGASGSFSTTMKAMMDSVQDFANSDAFESAINGISTAAQAAAYAIGGLAVAMGSGLVASATRAIVSMSLVKAFNAGAIAAKGYAAAVSILNRSLESSSGPIGLLITGSAALIGYLISTKNEVHDLTKGFEDLAKSQQSTLSALERFKINPNIENTQAWLDSIKEELAQIEPKLKEAIETLASYREQLFAGGQFMSQYELDEMNAKAAKANRLVEELDNRKRDLTEHQSMLNDKVEAYNQKLEDSENAMGALSEEQKKALATVEDRLAKQEAINALAAIENQYGAESVQYKLEQARQAHEVEMAEIASLEATLQGADAAMEKVNALRMAADASYDAETATIRWANAMNDVRAQITGVVEDLGQIGSAAMKSYLGFDFAEFGEHSTAAQKGILDLIKSVESGGDYNITLDNGRYSGGPRDLVNMTLNEVLAMQKQMLAHPDNKHNSSAAGAYQIVSKTLQSLISELGLTGNELYSKDMQDRLAMQLLRRRQGQGVEGLRNEWEGLRSVSPAVINQALGQQSIERVDPEVEKAASDALKEQVSERERQLDLAKQLSEQLSSNLLTEQQSMELERQRAEQVAAINASDLTDEEKAAAIAAVNAELEKQATILKLTEEAKRRGVELDAQMIGSTMTYAQAIEALGEAQRKQIVNQEQINSAQERAAQQQQFMNDMQDQLKNGLLDSIIAGESFAEVLANIAKQLARAALEAALFNSGPMAGGGWFGNLFGGLFGGGDPLSGALRGAGLNAIPGFANGTNFAPGGLALVGERGPELVNLSRGASVYNTQKSMNMLGNGAQGPSIHVSVDEGLKVQFLNDAARQSARITDSKMRGLDRNMNARIDQYSKDPDRRG